MPATLLFQKTCRRRFSPVQRLAQEACRRASATESWATLVFGRLNRQQCALELARMEGLITIF